MHFGIFESARSGVLAALLAMAASACSAPTPPPNPAGILVGPSAGVRYDRDPEKLASHIDELLKKAGLPAPGNVTAVVVPHAALRYSGAAAAAALAPVRDRRYNRVIILAPTHPELASGAVVPQARGLRTPLGDVPIDLGGAGLLAASGAVRRDDAPFVNEHAIDAVVPFIQRAVGAVPVLPVLVGPTDAAGARVLAEALRPLVDVHTLVVVSTNLAHEGPRFGNTRFGTDHGKELRARMGQVDTILLKPVLDDDLASFDKIAQSTQCSVCGRDALRVLLALLPPGARGSVRLYDNSFSHDDAEQVNQVSYAGIVFDGAWPELPALPAVDQGELLKAAHAALVASVGNHPPPPPPLDSPRLLEKRGVFITVYEKGELRASVGQLSSDVPLGRAVIDVAAAAATKDPRYPPFTSAELPDVRLEVAVLGSVRPVHDLAALDLVHDGLFLDVPGHSGMLLPDRSGHPQALDVVLDALAEKAGLARAQWPPNALSSFVASVMAEPGAELANDGGP